MKLNKKIVQIVVTALLSGIIVFAIMKLTQKPCETETFPSLTHMPWDVATAMMQNFVASEIMKTQNTDGTTSVLRGFAFEATEIGEILSNNHSGIKPDKLLILFGQDGTFNDEFGKTWPIVNLIAVGMKDNQMITSAEDGQNPSIFDKADPCPPNCPN